MQEMVPQESNPRPSAVQGYMSSFYRLINTTLFSNERSKDIQHCFLCLGTCLINFSTMSRQYGKWAAKNPTLVLCVSLAVVLVLCLGLIHLEVETRPEKVS